IDIGTNTALLLIAEVNVESRRLIPLRNEYRMPRIGQGVKKTGIISADRVKLLFDVLKEYEIIIKKYNCEKVIVTGTNALRLARNTPEISKELKRMLNYKLEVIPGDVEAEYAYLGATSDLDKTSSSLVIDIGGGSTELIFGNGSNIIFKTSLPIGSVSATEQFLKHSPPLKSGIESLNTEVKNLLKDLNEHKIPNTILAIAGTATTLACMKLGLKEFDEDKVEKSTLNCDEIEILIDELNQLTANEILDKYGPVMKGREDIILAGAIILSEIMNFFKIDKLNISSRGIRYGAVVKNLDLLL
ncbi:MAG: hypothetical protein WBN42_07780, partial [Ignavibacteriaceae bacterium]